MQRYNDKSRRLLKIQKIYWRNFNKYQNRAQLNLISDSRFAIQGITIGEDPWRYSLRWAFPQCIALHNIEIYANFILNSTCSAFRFLLHFLKKSSRIPIWAYVLISLMETKIICLWSTIHENSKVRPLPLDVKWGHRTTPWGAVQ